MVAASQVRPVGLFPGLQRVDGSGRVLGTVLIRALAQAGRLDGGETVVLGDLRMDALLVAPDLDHVEVEP